jgi:hypothetical protein
LTHARINSEFYLEIEHELEEEKKRVRLILTLM